MIKIFTRGEPSGDSSCSGVPCELEDGPLTVGSAGDDEDILRVLDGCDGSCAKHHLLPSLLQVDDVDAVVASLEDVGHHRRLGVFGSDVDGGRQHLGDVALLLIEIRAITALQLDPIRFIEKLFIIANL